MFGKVQRLHGRHPNRPEHLRRGWAASVPGGEVASGRMQGCKSFRHPPDLDGWKRHPSKLGGAVPCFQKNPCIVPYRFFWRDDWVLRWKKNSLEAWGWSWVERSQSSQAFVKIGERLRVLLQSAKAFLLHRAIKG